MMGKAPERLAGRSGMGRLENKTAVIYNVIL